MIQSRRPPVKTVSAGFDRSKYSNALLQRTREAFDKRDSSGKYGSYIKDEYQSKQWQSLEGDHLVDIIPFLVGPNHPHLKEGDVAFLLDVYIHRGIGNNEDSYICLSRTFNLPCPICEDQREKRRSGEYTDEDLKPLNPFRRTVYNVWVQDNQKEVDKGVQIWEVSQWLFDKHVSARAKSSRTGEFINYADPINGKSIQFQRTGKGAKNTEYLAHTFVDRDYEIPDEILEQALPLDQVITIPTYDEVYEAYFGVEKTKEKEEEEPDIPEKFNHPPTTVRRSPLSRQSVKEKVVEEQEQEQEGCPAGKEMGVDIGSLPECSDCAIWDDCSEMEKQLKSQEKERVEEPPRRVAGQGKVATPLRRLRR
jgi:hypothetical protein